MNYFALASLSVATVISLFLPSVPKSIYFHRNIKNLGSEKQSGANAAKASKILIWVNSNNKAKQYENNQLKICKLL